MRPFRAPPGPRATMFEIVGSWLGIWTAPRDVVIPPPPSRRTLALLTLGFAAVAAAFALVVLPALERTRERDETAAAREDEKRRAALLARLDAEQRPRLGTLEPGARTAMLDAVGSLIGADARRRFDPDARAATCEPAPGQDPRRRRVAFDCHSAIRDIVGGGQEGVRGALAIPFRAVVDFETGRYAFCKLNPPPGEAGIADPRKAAHVPRACRRPG